MLSRGYEAQNIQDCALWWDGPTLLSGEQTGLETSNIIPDNEEILNEERKKLGQV